MTSAVGRRQRTLELADSFVDEVRVELARAVRQGADLPPRIRSVHERVGHATPEFRTLAVPIPPGAEGESPEVLSEAIARYARSKEPQCLLLALDVVGSAEDGSPRAMLIAEARDRSGTRRFLVQPFEPRGRDIVWGEPVQGGWQDPGEEEMILDAAFRP